LQKRHSRWARVSNSSRVEAPGRKLRNAGGRTGSKGSAKVMSGTGRKGGICQRQSKELVGGNALPGCRKRENRGLWKLILGQTRPASAPTRWSLDPGGTGFRSGFNEFHNQSQKKFCRVDRGNAV